jgi:hypothetical protein
LCTAFLLPSLFRNVGASSGLFRRYRPSGSGLARLRCVERKRPMHDAVRAPDDLLGTAEAEVVASRIAERPTAFGRLEVDQLLGFCMRLGHRQGSRCEGTTVLLVNIWDGIAAMQYVVVRRRNAWSEPAHVVARIAFSPVAASQRRDPGIVPIAEAMRLFGCAAATRLDVATISCKSNERSFCLSRAMT